MVRERNAGLVHPLSAYDRSKLPRLIDGKLVFSSALAQTREFASRFWQETNELMTQTIDRRNFQIAVITANTDRQDVTLPLFLDLSQYPIGDNKVAANTPIAYYSDKERELRLVDEKSGIEHAYIIASPYDEKGFSIIRDVALQYKYVLGAKFVTLLTPFMAYGRQEKNINNNTGNYDGKLLTAASEIAGLSSLIDRFIVFEPHSFATQAFAGEFGRPLLPLSPWKYLIEKVEEIESLDRGNLVAVRPDKGRSLAAKRLQKYLGLSENQSVSFDKERDETSKKTRLKDLNQKEQLRVKGKDAILYDDEGSSLGTMEQIAEKLTLYGVSSMTVILTHAKFTPGWESVVKKIIEKYKIKLKIYITDSREPITDVEKYIKDHPGIIRKISLTEFVRSIIEADIAGINFYEDPLFADYILQPGQNE